MSRSAKAPLEDREVIAALKNRRSDAFPIIALPTLIPNCEASRIFFALCCVLRREQIWRMREILRASKRKEVRVKKKAINKSNTEYRKNRRLQRRNNPVVLEAERSRSRQYFLNNKAKVYAYRAEQRRTNPQYRIGACLRTYIYQKVGQKKPGPESRFLRVVGCSVAELCKWLEKHFLPGMTWQNYGKGDGKWSIDHTRPCALFDLTRDDQVSKCFHYSNLKPMWWRQNLQKKDKLSVGG